VLLFLQGFQLVLALPNSTITSSSAARGLGSSKIGLLGLNETDFKRHTEAIIQAELFKK